ncbi:Scr1 family TA system antitoxin-like transcriptional regulator [Nocardiopsis sp. NPDC055824]
MGFPEALARHLQLSGMTQRALATRSKVSPASLSRYLSGKTNPSRSAVDALDTALDAQGALLEAWRSSVSEELPAFLRDVDALERNASRIDLVSPGTVPGLLWSPRYAEAVYRAGRKVRDVKGLAQLRSERLPQLDTSVHAVFPATALLGVPEALRREQVSHLLALPDSVTLHVLPERTVLLGIPGPFALYRLRDGREVATSDHLEADAIYGDSVLPRVRELLRDALAVALPPAMGHEELRRIHGE